MAIMGTEQMQKAFEALSINIKAHKEILRQENLDALRPFCSDESAAAFFAEFSFDKDLEMGKFTYYKANCLKKNIDWADDFKRALEVNILPVGSGISGDIVVLDLLNFQAGILFHDYFWERDTENPRMFLVEMNCTLGEFYLNSAQNSDYPIDAYEAAAFTGSEFTGYSAEL